MNESDSHPSPATGRTPGDTPAIPPSAPPVPAVPAPEAPARPAAPAVGSPVPPAGLPPRRPAPPPPPQRPSRAGLWIVLGVLGFGFLCLVGLVGLVFAALIAAGMFFVSGITIPMTLHVPIPGLANVVFAPFCAFLLVLGLARLRKPGALLLIALINGLVSLPISPVIFSFVVVGGFFADAVSSLLFRGYRTRAAQVTGAVLFQLGIFPAAKFFSHFYTPERYQAIAAHIMLLAEGAILDDFEGGGGADFADGLRNPVVIVGADPVVDVDQLHTAERLGLCARIGCKNLWPEGQPINRLHSECRQPSFLARHARSAVQKGDHLK